MTLVVTAARVEIDGSIVLDASDERGTVTLRLESTSGGDGVMDKYICREPRGHSAGEIMHALRVYSEAQGLSWWPLQ
jgi:hypothetical protein